MPQQLVLDFVGEMVAAGFTGGYGISVHLQVWNELTRIYVSLVYLYWCFVPLQFLVALNFFATGSYQNQSIAYAQMSAPSFGRFLHKVSKFLAETMSETYVLFPLTVADRQAKAECFRECHDIPGVFGLVDGTHIALATVSKEEEMHYVNRKGYHSINTQIICDCDMNIISVNARYPGSTHDSFVWKSCIASAHMEDEHEIYPNTDLYLLGDSGYPLQPWLMTPVSNPRTNVEKHYNLIHSKTRNKVERCIGVLKNRFRCLLHEQKLRYSHLKSANIIYSCVVLHNFMNMRNFTDDDANSPDIDNNSDNHTQYTAQQNTPILQQAKVVRNRLMQSLYDNQN